MYKSRKVSFLHLFVLCTSVFLVSVTNIPGVKMLVSFASADTIPGGNVSGTWIQANSPYYITGNITIPAGQSLIINPGVEVNFLGNYGLTANGILNAVGTAADSILFFPENTSTGWMGISLAASSAGQTNQLSFCSVSYAGLSQSIHPGALVLSNCYFSNSGGVLNWDAIISGSTLQITDCVFRDNASGNGAALILSSPPDLVEITGCLFEDNQSSGYGGAIFISGGSNSIDITDCTFLGNTAVDEGGAIFAYDVATTITVENSLFGYNECFGPGSWEGGGGICSWGTDFDLSYCLFYENEGTYAGAFNLNHLMGSASVTMDHCTVWGVSPFFQVFIGSSGSTLSVSNGIFSHCDCAIYMNSGTVPDVEYTDFFDNGGDIQPAGSVPAGFGVLTGTNYNGDPCDVYINIFLDPEFEDPFGDIFYLMVTSPCIDAGDPTFPYDPDGTITDMGMYYFNQTGTHGESPDELLPSGCLLLCSPNPCYELLTVFFDIPGQSVEELAVYSIDGRQVVDMTDLCGSGTREAVLDVSCLNEGIYFCRLKAGSSSGTGRFVVIR
ncbi:MAG: right-handed parallel beta-helix repeat-containing protein [Candidatus Aegiribacteria sp.]|nr:right-handed parallel beta-helix repeat-containing protein [Candidatus Aegiribacteria sp.]